ncbi:hypothetical protein KR018_007977 [Drosophila ironensis]|nr:hypothetical protein KR018_007977 [Drosophila ironensis]
MNLLLWIVCCICLLKFTAAEERNFRIVIDEMTMRNVDPDVFEKLDCDLFQMNNRSYYNSSQIFKEVVNDFTVHVVLDFWKPNSKKIQVYDGYIDMCYFLENVQKNRLFKIYAKGVKKHSSVNFKCPFEPCVDYALHNMTFDEEDFPKFVPHGKFGCLLEYFINKKMSARAYINGKIIPRQSNA